MTPTGVLGHMSVSELVSLARAYTAVIRPVPTTGFKRRFSPADSQAASVEECASPKREWFYLSIGKQTLNRINHRCPLCSAWHARRISCHPTITFWGDVGVSFRMSFLHWTILWWVKARVSQRTSPRFPWIKSVPMCTQSSSRISASRGDLRWRLSGQRQPSAQRVERHCYSSPLPRRSLQTEFTRVILTVKGTASRVFVSLCGSENMQKAMSSAVIPSNAKNSIWE